MAATNLKAKSGNKFVIVFDGNPIGMCQSVEMRDEYSPEPLSGVGDIHVQEYVPTMAHHTLQVEEVMLNTNSMLKAGIAFENGEDALSGRVVDIINMDKETGEVVRKYMGCSYASGSIQVRKHAMIIANATFNALNVSGKG